MSSKLLEKLVFAAAFLHREFLGQRATERFLEDPGNPHSAVSYVFDTDIIGAYGAPWVGRESHGEDVTGRVLGHLLPRLSNAVHSLSREELDALRADEEVRAQNITRMLAEYCLKRGSHQEHLWQFEAHFGETERGIARARAQAAELGQAKPSDEQDQHMRNAVLILRARLQRIANDYNPHEVAESVMSIAAIYLRRENLGPNRILRQLERLDSLEARFSARRRLTHPDDLPGIKLPRLSAEKEAEHEAALKLLSSFWRREIGAARTEHDDGSNNRDADSLAALAIINKRLIDAGIRRRVVFVTGTFSLPRLLYTSDRQLQKFIRNRAIQETLQGRDREEANGEHQAWRRYFGFPAQGVTSAPQNWFGNFSLHYIRHLWAFAKDALIESSETSKLESLFHGLFALHSEKATVSQSEVEDLLLRPWSLRLTLPETDPDDLYRSTLKEWDRLIQGSVEQHTEERLGLTAKAMATLQRTFPDNSGVNAAEVAALIRELVDRQRDRSMLELSDMGAMSLIIEKELAVRFPPDLYFQSLPRTDSIFKSLFDNSYLNNGAAFVQDYGRIYEDCVAIEETESGDDRQLSYLKFLVLGAVFASTEKWATALGHATRAINTVKRYPREKVAVKKVEDSSRESNMSGREAYYLAAFCSRMVSSMGQNQHVMGTSSAQYYLAEARRAYRQDVASKPNLRLHLNELRFDCEELAQELSRYYLTRYRDAEVKRDRDLGKYDLGPLYRSANNLLSRLGRSDDSKFPFGLATTFQTQISIATNLLQAATIRAFREERGFPDYALQFYPTEAVLERCVSFLKSLHDRPQSASTSLVRVYMNAGAVLIGRLELTDLTGPDDVSRLFDNAAPARVLAYDRWRFDMLKGFLVDRVRRLTAARPKGSETDGSST